MEELTADSFNPILILSSKSAFDWSSSRFKVNPAFRKVAATAVTADAVPLVAAPAEAAIWKVSSSILIAKNEPDILLWLPAEEATVSASPVLKPWSAIVTVSNAVDAAEAAIVLVSV